MGRVLVDNVQAPTVALIELDFWFLAGDSTVEGVRDVVRSVDLPASYAVTDSAWAQVLRNIWGEALHERTRVEFESVSWDRARLRNFVASAPAGMEVRRVEADDLEAYEELAESLVYNFESLEDFFERGVGFGIEVDGRWVSGCSSFAISSHSLEFEIQTHPDFRRRGLATATAARMIEHCLDEGLEPCWDAHNEMSAGLAVKLGFSNPQPYIAYEVPPNAKPVDDI
jgi:GNAT superfamily N-acetyltransferase